MNQEPQAAGTRFEITTAACLRCAACSTLAPQLFQVGHGPENSPARVRKQPGDSVELALARSAAALCPGSAIHQKDAPPEGLPIDITATETEPPPMGSVALCDRLAFEAEAVRWRMRDLPWDKLDRSQIKPEHLSLLREVVLSELTTFSASKRFLSEYADDVDFSQWIAVWLYEETKHSQAFIHWLRLFDVEISPSEMLKARVTTPFMKSRTGTLTSNIISELIASTNYVSLSRHSKEPLLRAIAWRISGDEARHGASFYVYARQRIERSPHPDQERMDALKVLYFWLCESQEVSHPIGVLKEKLQTEPALLAEVEKMQPDAKRLQRRGCELVGNLIDLPLSGKEDIMPALREMAARSRTNHGST